MNTITHAFKQSGIQLPPLNKRVWLWLHDHPGKTYSEVAKAIGAAPGNVSSTLGNMVKRRMVAASSSERYTGKGLRNTTVYRTASKEFELLPLPRKAKAPPIPQMPLSRVEQPKPAVIPPAPKAVLSVLSVLENYTLRELRAIRDALNNLFEHV